MRDWCWNLVVPFYSGGNRSWSFRFWQDSTRSRRFAWFTDLDSNNFTEDLAAAGFTASVVGSRAEGSSHSYSLIQIGVGKDVASPCFLVR